MIELTVAEVATLLGVSRQDRKGTQARFEKRLPSVSIDSRRIRPGQCFVAIKGERFDGHDFVDEALRKGAAVVIHSRPREPFPLDDQVFLRVDDTTGSLQILGQSVRRKWGKPLVAVTGSVGKTTAKEFAAALLGQKFQVFKSEGNLNNEIGVPLSLLEIEESHGIAVLELGMSHPGEIRALSRICAPEAAILTNVAAVHLEFFSNIDEIAEAKGEVLESLDPEGQLFFNADDPRVFRLALRHPGKRISFGLEAEADVRIISFSFDSPGAMRFEIDLLGQRFRSAVPFAGKHFLYHIAAGAAAASGFGVSREEIAEGLSLLRPVAMRGRVIESEGVTVWDDSYNSSPQALAAILETAAQLQGFHRKIFVLGEMLELGPRSPEFHRQAGRRAAQEDPALLVTVGKNARHLAQSATDCGFPGQRVHQFQDSTQAAEFIADQIRPGDLLVVKGSRGTRMDRVVQRITEGQKV